jgi:hypothetical protein
VRFAILAALATVSFAVAYPSEDGGVNVYEERDAPDSNVTVFFVDEDAAKAAALRGDYNNIQERDFIFGSEEQKRDVPGATLAARACTRHKRPNNWPWTTCGEWYHSKKYKACKLCTGIWPFNRKCHKYCCKGC